MGATLKDVAREARVSMASVSRAINGTGAVTPEIRTRILEAASRLHYVPNSGAQSLMTRRTRMIGVLLPRFHGEFFSELIRGIDAAARARGLHLLVSTAHDAVAETGDALRAMIGRVDGALVMLPHVDGRFIRETIHTALPMVLLSTADADHTHTSVYVDNYGGACALMRHLIAIGCKRIVHIAGPAENMDAQERLRGYRDTLAELLPNAPEYLLQGDFNEDSGYKAGQLLLSTSGRPDAVFAANDMMAIGCMSALLDAGLQLPRDMAVVGFDDIPTAKFVRPPLTTVRVKIADLGARALDQLAEVIDNPNEVGPHMQTVPAELVIRASCGAAPESRSKEGARRLGSHLLSQ
ncbi:MAG TPA: LacI family DNA-binding transcriptional regulator [Steroidobacteraceae bacterium]|nr:LacI family DNA-binding transcriptional regulator [Steroidobacteraceae bacterium]